MKYDFDKIIDRRNTESLKFDSAAKRGVPQDALPLWVADMDFPAPEAVTRALTERAEHGIFGYSEPDDSYFDALCRWFSVRHGWECGREKFVLAYGVVAAICALIQTVTQPGDAVIVCQPVYYPFSSAVTDNGRKLIVSELVNDGGVYRTDFDDFERKIRENGVKAFILCSPHNPVGRVWTKDELRRMGEICLRHGVFVISDEIHADFVYGDHHHTVFPTVDPAFEAHCAVCTAPSKTFNLAGLHNANIYVPDDGVRRALLAQFDRWGFSQSNVMGIVGCRAAYREGGDWLDALLNYLQGNIALVREFLHERLPEIALIEPQGTYLLWLDFTRLGLSDRELRSLIRDRAKLWLDDGYIFGAGGSGFQRINVACPRSTLQEALTRLERALRA